MKYTFYIACCCCFLAVFGTGCHKKNDAPPATFPGTLVAKWQLVVDSTNPGYNPGGFRVYWGVPADYFDFRADGMLYIRKGSFLDTLEYKIYPDSTFALVPPGTIIPTPYYPQNTIFSVTTHSAVIQIGTSIADAPSDMIHLKR